MGFFCFSKMKEGASLKVHFSMTFWDSPLMI